MRTRQELEALLLQDLNDELKRCTIEELEQAILDNLAGRMSGLDDGQLAKLAEERGIDEPSEATLALRAKAQADWEASSLSWEEFSETWKPDDEA